MMTVQLGNARYKFSIGQLLVQPAICSQRDRPDNYGIVTSCLANSTMFQTYGFVCVFWGTQTNVDGFKHAFSLFSGSYNYTIPYAQ